MQKGAEVKILSVPFALQENINITTTNTSTDSIESIDSKEEIINQALKFHSEGNIKEAIRFYQYFINQGYEDYRTFTNYGVILTNLGRLQEAEISTRKAIEINPNFANAHSNLGSILKNLGKLKDAEISYNKAIKLNSNFADAHYNLGCILKNLGRLQEAELSFSKAIEIKPDYANAHSNLGLILKDLGKLKEAELLQRKAIELNPDYANAHSNLGITLRDLGKSEEAELSTRKAIELNPNLAEAHSNLGTILIDLGKLQEAELSTRKAIELNADYAMAHSNLGNILRDLGKLEEAEISLREAINLKPDLAGAHCNLGNVFKDLGKLEEAENSYTKAISLEPDFSMALMNRWQIYFDQKKFHLALNDSNSCNTELSRLCSLETLYALGRIEEIYEMIEKNSKLDEVNISIAAFASFIAEQENKYTANNFCQKPLSFLYFSNIKNHLKDCNTFIKEIIRELLDLETIWEPPKNSTHNGFHTPTNINLFSNSSKNISQLKSIILNELDSYYLKYKKESCTYIQKWPSNKKLHAWNVILKKQGYQDSHIHPSGWLSGVIYLKVVPSLNNNEGAIEFSLNGVNYFNPNSPELIHQPKVGDVVFFPSSLYHRTIPFSTDTDRIVVAFDLLPN
tara:strand:+ start:110 stop:1990 length:1881 start_codon:yes stop_codon:yes gene_type:complete